MAKMMLHDDEARAALGRGVAQLARAVRGTMGPRGMNAIIDRPIGTPMVSRDGVSIAAEVELACRFENMGAQILREVSAQTNLEAGDGTTTATVLADALVQKGLARMAAGDNAVELVAGIEAAADEVIVALRARARPLRDAAEMRAVATIAANDAATGALVAEAIERAGPQGIVTVENSTTVETMLDVIDGMGFDRGYISHHMVTDVERMQAVLDNPLILMTDLKITTAAEIEQIRALVGASNQPLLVIAEEVAPAAVMALLADRAGGVPVAAIHPPEYGHWRKAMLEDIAIITGGRVIARELGGTIANATRADLGSARQVRVGSGMTVISGGGGDLAAIAARREQVRRQVDLAPNDIDRDKLEQRLAKLSGGTATIMAGGATPVAQKRHAQLIEDSLAAARAAIAEGVVAGGGTALAQIAPSLNTNAKLLNGARAGALLLRDALTAPLAAIATNSGFNPEDMVAQVMAAIQGTGLDARTGKMVAMEGAGIIDPVRVSISALRNAVSVASLILTTHTLIADKPDYDDPTAGPALGGGAELLGRA
ncbi:MAG: molecular chaperone GroEL [Acidiphilium sp. 37-64-53]|uniref:molecular chaperone GroEL n=1 Tax=Acidiphilium TaxID=522 RepID=UPI000BC84042|nr:MULTISPECIES: molecular chaperone GroEL [Acidiphilium]OYW01543.1 MAG: molecular chaperone GroEL [Acidiphilium sp. 37-64-53]OZB29282.1 MAG: molecular chaperone GroEL [Acidiphilium sp. 34-64-41]HQT86392.1 molecular chaperone GroEL [Acidiphilium rubrum]